MFITVRRGCTYTSYTERHIHAAHLTICLSPVPVLVSSHEVVRYPY